MQFNIKKVNFLLIFKIFYLIHVLLAFNCFTFKSRILDVTSILILLFGAAILFYKLLHYKELFKCKFILLWLLFFVSYAITMFVNYKYGLIGNIKGGVWLAFQCIILFCIEQSYEQSTVKKELKVISAVLITYTAVCNLIGLIMMIRSYGGRFFYDDGSMSCYGFIWGRLWGCYTDPNHGGLITAVAILAAIYLILISKKLWIKIIYSVSIVLNYLYIVFSDSRSSKLSFVLAFFVLSLLTIGFYSKRTTGRWKKAGLYISALVVTAIVYFSFNGTKNFYNYCIIQSVEENIEEIEIVIESEDAAMNEVADESKEAEIVESVEQEKQDIIEQKTVGREQDIENDFSNRRFDIWGSSIEIFDNNKVFGVGYRNILDYAKTELPDTYIVNNDHGEFDSFHNVIFDVLASQGIVGMVIVLALGISILCFSIKGIFIKKAGRNIEVAVLLSMVIVLLAGSMFVSAIFYVNSPETVLFWTLLGYLVYSIEKYTDYGVDEKDV